MRPEIIHVTVEGHDTDVTRRLDVVYRFAEQSRGVVQEGRLRLKDTVQGGGGEVSVEDGLVPTRVTGVSHWG